MYKVLIIVLLIVCIVSSYSSCRLKNEVLRTRELMETVQNRVIFVENDLWGILKYDDSRVISPDLLLRNVSDEICDVQTLLDGEKKVVVRYTELNCNSCVDSLLVYASSFVKDVGESKVQVWASYSNLRDFHLVNRLNKYNLSIFNLQGKLLEMDKLDIPYVFILDGDLIVRKLFIPHKELPNNTKRYFEMLKKEFE